MTQIHNDQPRICPNCLVNEGSERRAPKRTMPRSARLDRQRPLAEESRTYAASSGRQDSLARLEG